MQSKSNQEKLFWNNAHFANVASVIIISFILAACTWVKLSKEAESVVIKSHDEITACKKVAKVTASLQSTIIGVERNTEKVKTELETLARNKAVEFKGNTLVPSSEVVSGMQDFDVYQCP